MRLPLLLSIYTAGLVCADYFCPLPGGIVYLPLFFAVVWLAVRRHKQFAWAVLLALTFSAALSLYQLNRFPPLFSKHVLHFAGETKHIIDGRVAAVTDRSINGYALDIDVQQRLVETSAYPTQGRLRLYVESGICSFTPGDRIRFSSKLRKVRHFGTPGEFDQPRHLAANRIFVTGYVEKAEDILLLMSVSSASFPIERARTATARFIANSVSPRLAPLVGALAIGDKGGLTPDLSNLLARGGVSHLFAISGLNLALIAAILYAVGLSIYRRSETMLLFAPPPRFLPIIITPALVAYLFWTGAGLSTQRALLMAAALTGLLILRRHTAPLNYLWSAAFIILLIEPLALFEPSFQLSFVALAGIIFGYSRWRSHLEPLPKAAQWFATLFLSSLAATLATSPLILFHFHLLAPAGIFINIVAIPMIGWLAAPMALAGSLIWALSPECGALLFQGCGVVISWMLSFTRFIVSFPFLSGWTLYTSLPVILSLTLLTIALFLPTHTRRSRIALVLAALPVLLLCPRPPACLTVTALSVGQGESLLVSAAGRNYLIDAGGLYGDRFDTGRRLVAPALGRLGVSQLDAVIMTHAHPDHAKGIDSILTDFPCRLLIHGEPIAPASPLAATIASQQVPCKQLPSGWTKLLADNDISLEIYRPASGANDNDRSLAIYARAGDQGALLPGDLETAGVKQLLTAPPSGPVTLLKLPHHGSQRSSPELLIDAYRSPRVFVSVGDGNRFGFPHRSVVTTLQKRNIDLRRTDQDGSFRYTAMSSGWTFEKL